MERHFQDQLERIDRLMKIILSDDQQSLLGSSLNFEDVSFFACQSIWHLKDWILSDTNFQAKDTAKLKTAIHSQKCLLICADIANGSKHLILKNPKVGAVLGSRHGMISHPSKGIYKIYYYVTCTNTSDSYHGTEIRELLNEARVAWDKIIDEHYLSVIDVCQLE